MPRKTSPAKTTDKPAARRGGRPRAGKQPREQFMMMLNTEERAMIRLLGIHYGVDGLAAALRQAALREYRRLDPLTISKLNSLAGVP